MQENSQDGQRTDISHQEIITSEELAVNRSPISKLISHRSLGYIPAHEKARQKASDGQEYLTGYKVEDVEKRLAAYLQHAALTQRE